MVMQKVKSFILLYMKGYELFHEKRGANLAAASTFFLLITLVPLGLLSFKLVGLLLGDVQEVMNESFVIITKFFPDVLPEFIVKIKQAISRPLMASSGITLLNIFFLALSTFSLFNSIWSGLYLITDNKGHISLKKALKDLFVIGFTVSFLGTTLFIPTLLKLIKGFLTDARLMAITFEILPRGDVLLSLWLKGNSFFFSLFESDLFYFTLLVAYVTILFHWFFNRLLIWKESLFCALSFVVSLSLLKSLFWIYFKYARTGLIQNYGDFYTVVFGVMWLYFAMCCFYFSLCLCEAFVKKDVKRG